MRKFRNVRNIFVVLVALMLVLTSISTECFAKGWNNDGLRHIDVYVNGTITVDTQVDGVSQRKKTGTITVSDLTAKVVDSGQEKVYTRFTKQTQANQSKELEFHTETSSFTKSATITITGTMKSGELGINTSFTKVVSGSAIDAAVEECPYHIGCDIRITDTEIVNTITHNVTFKTEAGGKINGGTENINYTNVIDGSVFPEIPKTEAESNYEFVGWFNESGNQVTNFPKKVTEDYVFVAKWKKVSENPTPVTPVAAAYFVKHYQQQKDGSYAEVKADTEKLTGKIGEKVTAKPKTYDGYNYNSTKSEKTATGIVIKPETIDGKLHILTLELYYDIKSSDPGTNPGKDPGTKPNPDPGIVPTPNPTPTPDPVPTPDPTPVEEPTETPEPTEVPEPSTNPEPSTEKPKPDSNSKSEKKAKTEKVQKNTEDKVLTNVPRTGESNSIFIVIAIAVTSAIVSAWLFVSRKKSR